MKKDQEKSLDIGTPEHQLLEQRNTTDAVKNLLPAAEGSLLKHHENGEHLKTIAENTKPKDIQKIELHGAQITAIKGDKGDTPQRGVDYYTDEERKSIVDEILPKATPIAGQHYYTEAEKQAMASEIQGRIRIPEDGKTPVKGIDYDDGARGKPGEKGEPSIIPGPPGVKGDPGINGSPDSAKEIREKLHSLPEGSRLDYNNLDNVPDVPKMIRLMKPSGIASKTYAVSEMSDVSMQGIITGQVLQWDGRRFIPYTPSSSGVTSVYGEDVAANGSGVTYNLLHTPTVGSVRLYRGGTYQKAGAGNAYTISGTTITLLISGGGALQIGEELMADYTY